MNSELQQIKTSPMLSAVSDPRVTAITTRLTPLQQLPTPPELSDKYSILQELGSGAQGKVFLALRTSDDKKVAIKQLCIDSIKTWKEYTLFHREADVLATLSIPGVVKFYEARDCLDANPPCSYIVQEYIEGMTLKQMLHTGYRFTLNRVFDIVLQILDILEKLHTHEPPIIHRDIKPSNIIIRQSDNSDDFQVYLIDFGAVANPQIQSGGSTIAGTFGYMSPEQNLGRPTPQSDTYALAALTAYLISGVEPASMKTQDLRLIIGPYVENHPTALVQTLRRMLEPNLQDRLSDLSELRQRFTAFKNGNYILQNEHYAPYSHSELRKRLLKVHALCQPQNLELWQNLPDLPQHRPDFPIKLTTQPRFEHYPISKKAAGDSRNPDTPKDHMIAWIVWTLLLSPIVLGCVDPTIIYIFKLPILPTFVVSLLLCFLIVAEVDCIKNQKCSLLQWLFKLKHTPRGSQLPWIEQSQHLSAQNCPNHLVMFQHGRKTIATVTEIEHLPLKANDHFHHNDYLRAERPPTFRIYYKFNPPDDDSEYDLIHAILVHTDLTGSLKEGDPLPILYIGTGSPMHVIQSMPYPFPLDDLETPDDYIGRPRA